MDKHQSIDHSNNLYLETAAYYDMDTATYSERDLSFYLDLARRGGGRVLELACGTGRITLPLVHAGFEVWALDLSRPMLDELERKASRLPEDVRARLHVVHADMCDFQLNIPFELIAIPFRGFQALVDQSQVEGCLASVRRHLASNGRFVVNTFQMDPSERLSEYVGERTDWERSDPVTGEHVRRTRRILSVDHTRQVFYPEVIYYVTRDDGTVERFSDCLALRYYYEYQLQVQLISSGFRISAAYGDFDRRDTGKGPEFIFVCRHSVGVPALG
ncbi:MAG: class I SAM-dependent methyltransferase [bacterium]